MIDDLRFIRHMPGLMAVKSCSSEYIGFTDTLARFVGWDNSEQALGKTDYQLPCKASEYADKFVAEDLNVINTDTKILNLKIYEFADGMHSLIVQKTPFKNNNGQIVGIFCQSFDVSNTNIFKCFKSLSCNDQKIISNLEESTTYILNSEHCPLPLPPRQQECVFWLIRGKTFKEIAFSTTCPLL